MPKKRYKKRKIFRTLLTITFVGGGIWLVAFCTPINHFFADLVRSSFFSNRGSSSAYVDSSDTIAVHAAYIDSVLSLPHRAPVLIDANGTRIVRKITGVKNYDKAFPDLQDVQLLTAQRLGIQPQKDKAAVVKMVDEMKYIGNAKNYRVDTLYYSVPYLVPRAARLLDVIAQAFADSLQAKGLEPHKFIVTSATRTEEDVRKLRKRNRNATENSCHQYGTTVDITYNRFVHTASDTIVNSMPLLQVLCEVMRDQRKIGTCYVKYERRQACLHFTAR